jgi:hypothetical protein
MAQATLRDAMRSIDEVAAGLDSPEQRRRLAVVRVQLSLLAQEIDKPAVPTSMVAVNSLLHCAAE